MLLLIYNMRFHSTRYTYFVLGVATAEFCRVARGSSFLTGNVWGRFGQRSRAIGKRAAESASVRYHVSHPTWLIPYRSGDKSCIPPLCSVECDHVLVPRTTIGKPYGKFRKKHLIKKKIFTRVRSQQRLIIFKKYSSLGH